MSSQLTLVISGPSGVGKTTVVNALLETGKFQRVVTTTTRQPRAGEVAGYDYNFETEESFLAKHVRGEFFEVAKVHGNYYGSPKNLPPSDKHYVIILDTQGFTSAMENGAEFLSVFLLPPPPYLSSLTDRMLARGESPGSIAARLTSAREELQHADEYDISIVNSNLEETVQAILDFVGGDN